MTPTEPQPAILVRVDQTRAGDEAGLLHDRVRERIEALVESLTHEWGVDRAAVTVEAVPPPRLQLRRPSAEELAEHEQLMRQRIAALPDGVVILHFDGVPIDDVPTDGVEDMSALKRRWAEVYGRMATGPNHWFPLVERRGMIQARPPWWRRWFRRD